MDQNSFPEYKVTKEIVAAFVEAVDNEAFILADVADVMGIEQEEATAILLHVMEHDILRLKCVWVVERPPRLSATPPR
ncbi:hypothetical protein [Pedobacter frigoris]|uniref:Uncharacterized protein n=1 Tax=Pedobacter frigoris TaxID=2571272 RepID=A0A4U1CNZ9_9SPHI|nr:hypothetical protein [Pedobacter frigoris]TKC08986.1 hypothetical protein FA047_02505 [Pedobacter frigoris]